MSEWTSWVVITIGAFLFGETAPGVGSHIVAAIIAMMLLVFVVPLIPKANERVPFSYIPLFLGLMFLVTFTFTFPVQYHEKMFADCTVISTKYKEQLDVKETWCSRRDNLNDDFGPMKLMNVIVEK